MDIRDDSPIPDGTDQRSGGPLESSTNIDQENVQSKRSKQSHRYALRSRGSCDLPADDNQDARDELVPEGN